MSQYLEAGEAYRRRSRAALASPNLFRECIDDDIARQRALGAVVSSSCWTTCPRRWATTCPSSQVAPTPPTPTAGV